MGESVLHLLLLQLCLAALVHSQPQCILITPNVLRVNSEETVVVELHNQNNPIDVDITVHDFPQKRQTLFATRINLNAGNQFLNTAKITVPPKDLKQDSKGKQFVYVTAKSNAFQVEKVVLVSFHSGYIFIQADKTIYTPGSTVYYRMFTMGHKLQPVAKTLIVEFETPDGIIVKRDTVIADVKGGGIVSQSHKLPDLVNMGTWTIAARFEDSPMQSYTTQFDLKEYVLPSFEVKIEPEETFFYLDTQEFNVEITARFLYGKPVDGDAFILFGVLIDGEKKSIPTSLRRVEIKDGHGSGTLTRNMLKERFENLNELLGHSIYVSVTVLTASGSDMVEAEKSDIRIVTSPYKLLFEKTSKYFKPGMPFDLMVFVTNPDGSPANRIAVKASAGTATARGSTLADGTTKLTLNTASTVSSLTVNVETAAPQYPEHRQAKASMVASAYTPQGGSKNYLHIGVTSNELKPGDTLNVNFNVRSDNLNQIKFFTYLIMSKGKIYTVARQDKQVGQALVTLSLLITPELIPSFRFVGFYYVANEIVADSVWVDVKDSCMGTLVVSGATERDSGIHEPGKSMRLKLKGDHKAKVGMVAVDKAVYVLNKKHKISQTKVWDSVEKNDIGCTPGSGANNVGVFFDAGLALETSFQISTPQRTDAMCPQPGKRKRRSVQLIEHKAGKAAQYKDKSRKCCEDGMYENAMAHSCQRRSKRIRESPECVKAFIECCEFISKIRVEKRREQLILARSDVDDGYLSEDDVISRTEFPESWFWKVEDLLEAPDKDGISTKVMNVFLKDSITTWEVLAVSLSENKGICVADPYEITVMKDFFMDLRLPYSVTRNEQVEIRAVLYNYREDPITVRVELMYNEKICSASTSKKKFRQEIKLNGKSSRAVPFTLVPLDTGSHDVEVKAYVFGSFATDGVKKKLKVVAEGIQMNKTVTVVTLDPAEKGGQDGVQEEKVKAADLKDMVPKTDSETTVRIQGTPITQLLENSIDGKNLHHLIVVPSGCGEQNMITLTPSVITTHYLDNTGQWESLGVNRRAEAIKYMQQGYTQQLAYRQPANCYAAWTTSPGSTWLTAYVAKVFAMASSLIDIQKDVLCGAVKWLILEKQKPDGIFQEDAPVIHGEMVGGYRGAEPEASLTAFVLIAMAESRKICGDQVNSLEGSIQKAADYLVKTYPNLQKPYAIAITAYALAMVDKLPQGGKLMQASTDETHWKDPSNNLFSIEASSYALLALLRSKNFEKTGGIVRWLTQQRFYGGVYGSTQATVMVYQALAQYEMDTPSHKDLNLDVSIKLPGRRAPANIRINFANALVSRSEGTKLNQDFTVEARGTGQATLTVVTVYNALLAEKESKCKMFDLSVTVKEDTEGRKPEGSISSVTIEVCTRYLGNADSTMTILDISMLTGFSPDIDDLRRLSEPVDRYISKFEVEKGLSDKGKLIIYLDQVSRMENDCLKFRAHQFFKVGLIQPAAVTVYEYYALDNRCTKFYHPDKESGLLSKICQGDVCRCAEENCFMQRVEDAITWQDRVDKACQPGVDYVYKARLTRIETRDSYDNYMMIIEEVLKAGSDEAPQGKIRRFISPQKCRDKLNLEDGKDYLVWGLITDLWLLPEETSYNIGKDTWMELWPNEEECQNPEHENICQDLSRFSDNMVTFGCPN